MLHVLVYIIEKTGNSLSHTIFFVHVHRRTTSRSISLSMQHAENINNVGMKGSRSAFFEAEIFRSIRFSIDSVKLILDGLMFAKSSFNYNQCVLNMLTPIEIPISSNAILLPFIHITF